MRSLLAITILLCCAATLRSPKDAAQQPARPMVRTAVVSRQPQSWNLPTWKLDPTWTNCLVCLKATSNFEMWLIVRRNLWLDERQTLGPAFDVPNLSNSGQVFYRLERQTEWLYK